MTWGTPYWSSSSWGAPYTRVTSGEVECRYVLFFDGLAAAYSNDEPTTGGITGSGAGTWIGYSETAIGGVEVLGQRTVKPGLILPESIEFGGDPKGLGLDRSTVTFKIVDRDDTVASLFATEGVVPDILLEHVAPGTTVLGTSVAAEGPTALGTGTVNPRGQWIGLERIGPSGQRRMFPAIPFSLVGFDHQGDVGDRLPPTPISSTPVIHAGRLVTLYRIYADPSVATTDPARWYTWDEAHSAGDLVWWGVMQDSGTYEGNRVWSVECFGPEAALERGLGVVTDPTPLPISASIPTNTGVNDQIFIRFSNSDHQAQIDSAGTLTFGWDNFQSGQGYFQGRAWTTLSSTARIDLVTEIDGLISDTYAGTSTDYQTGEDTFDAWADVTPTLQNDHGSIAGITYEQGFYVQANDFPAATTIYPSYGIMYISMHRSRWEALGYDVVGQNLEGTQYNTTADGGEFQVNFKKLVKGEDYPYPSASGGVVPGNGYYEARFTTVGVGGNEDNGSELLNGDIGLPHRLRNDGNRRHFWPINSDQNQIFTLDLDGHQEISFGDSSESPFWEPQPTVPRTADAQVNSTDTDSARWFVLKGKLRTKVKGEDGESDIEEEEHVAVCQASWREGTNYGDVQVGANVDPAVFIQRYYDPRLFGFNRKRFTGTWKGDHNKFPITIAPLNCYTFGRGKPIEWAHLLFGVLLLSTGTSTGFDAPLSDGGVLDLGENQPAGLTSTGDVELADLGLGIPHQLVADWSAISAEFARQAGGLGGDLNRMRLCYSGPFESRDALEAILKPRRLAIGLHGKKYGVYRFDAFSPDQIDVTITEDDLYGDMANPTDVIPTQAIRAHGALDGAKISYGYEPGGSAQLEHRQKALDINARWRRGDLVEELNGRGLIPNEWMQGTKAEGADWKPLFLTEWGRKAPAFFAKRHFMIEELTVSRPKGQDIMPGTRVLLSNPWPLAPDGTYGLANRLGIVIGVRINLRDHSTTCRVLVYGDVDFPPHYAPFVYVTSIASDTITYDTTGTRSGYLIDECETSKGWTRPSYTTLPDEGIVRLWYQTDDGTWAQSGTGTVESIDTDNGTITLTSSLSAEPPSNTYTMILTFDDYLANADTFVEDIYAPTTNHAGLWDTAGTAKIGKKWLE